jgi:hypothetical protein
MKSHVAVLLLILSASALAQSVGARDVQPLLDQMQAAGKITPQQAEITRKYMQNMKAEDWQRIEARANKAIERNPAAAERVGEEGIEALDMKEFDFKD